jgi:hypothetical protein
MELKTAMRIVFMTDATNDANCEARTVTPKPSCVPSTWRASASAAPFEGRGRAHGGA